MGDKGLPAPPGSYNNVINNLSNITLATDPDDQSANRASFDRVGSYVNVQQCQSPSTDMESKNIRQSNWREEESTIRRKWEYALDHGLFTDLLFHIGKRREAIKAHSLIFNLQSSKFAEKYPAGECKTEFDWIEPGPFHHFLKYLYTETINVNIEDALWVLFIAQYFEIGKLVRICEDKIMKDISVQSAAFIYQKSYDFDCKKLEQLAKDYIIKHAAAVFETDGILQLTSITLGAILESPARKIDEVKAFQGILRWAKAEYCRDHYGDTNEVMGMKMDMPEPDWTAEHVIKDLQSILKPVIGYIDFYKFSGQEFVMHVHQSKILSPEENSTIMAALIVKTGQGHQAAAGYSSLPPNIPIPSTVFMLDRYNGPKVDEFWREETGTDKISFRVNKPVDIVGFGLFGTSEAATEKQSPEKIEVGITSYDESRTLENTVAELALPKPAGVFELHLENPVRVDAGEWYTVHIKMAQVKPYGTGGKKKYEVTAGNTTVVWEFMNAKGIAGFSLGRGQIPQILFSV